ncbi:MAG: NAD(P)H-quinone oxidoreductase [Pseudomonadota bacterium]
MTTAIEKPPETMRAIEIEAPGGPEMLRPTTRPTPRPMDNEVLIKIAAAGVNRPDVLQRMGLYPPPPGASDLPGLEASGVIVGLGSKVDAAARLALGDAVCALLPGGGYAEYASVDAGACLPLPKGLSLEAAAGVPETYFTVWANVFDDAGLAAGETLLVHGGTSGIGVTAIALAKALGARVLATASSAEKCASITALGADGAYRYDDPEGFEPWDAAIAAEGGVDVVLDMAGGDFFARNLGVLKERGRHVSIAFLRGARGETDIFAVMRKRLTISGSTMKARNAEEKAAVAKALKDKVWPLIEAGAVTPRVHKTFSLDDAAAAHRMMEAGDHLGKIVLTMD